MAAENKVYGRFRALQCLDELMEEEESVRLLHEHLKLLLMQDGVSFFTKIILPTVPKETLIKLDPDAATVLKIELHPKLEKEKSDVEND